MNSYLIHVFFIVVNVLSTSYLHASTQSSSSSIKIWVKSAEAPTIWVWTENSAISEEMGFTWQKQQKLLIDTKHPEYYYWQLPDKYAAQISSRTPLKFKLNAKGYAYSIARSGCLDDDKQWDNASDGCFLKEDYRPYIGPYLTLISPDLSDNNETVKVLDPATSMVINYETNARYPNWRANVQYRELGSQTWMQVEEQISGRRIHHIALTGLLSDRTYEYRVISPDGQQGKVYRFDTAPKRLDESHFLAIGDMQDPGDSNQRWQDVANAIVANHLDDFRFIITVGDMAKDDISHNGQRYYFWKVFFDKGRQLFARKPIMPTPGNHDTPENIFTGDPEYLSNAEDTASYRKYFNLPTDMAFADYYHFDYGNAHFMSLNSEIPVFYGRHPQRDQEQRVKRQREWLTRQLNRPVQSTWNFAYWHVPAINPAGGKSEVDFMRPLTDLFHTKLDWLITGHVHENQRVKPTIANARNIQQVADYGRLRQQGVGYFICPPAGQWPRDNSSRDMHLLDFYPHYNGKVAYEIGYSIFQTTARTLRLTTYGMGDVNNRNHYRYGDNGSVRMIDQLSYSKVTPPEEFLRRYTTVDFRGSQNNWQRTPFLLVADNTWQIDIAIDGPDSFFKFYLDGDWHGDNQPDGIALTDEASNILIAQGIGSYRITLDDRSLRYHIEKL